MKTRHLTKALVGLVAAVAAVGLLGLPASANDADITSGTLDIYASASTLYSSQDLSGTGSTECAAGSGTIDVDSTGAFNASFNSNTSTNIGGTDFTVLLSITLAGTMTSGGAISGSGSATATLYQSSTCATTGTPCSIVVSNININGTSDVINHEVEVDDTATVSGDTGDHGQFEFNVSVTGNCGSLLAVDDGSVTITDVVVEATT